MIEFKYNENGELISYEDGKPAGRIITMGDILETDRVNKKPYPTAEFASFKQESNLDNWEGFPELMSNLGFVMDCGHSFDDFQKNCGLTLKHPISERERKRNILYLLEHAGAQIVGNYLFSEWRYFTHWSNGYDEYDVDFLRRIIAILESKL